MSPGIATEAFLVIDPTSSFNLHRKYQIPGYTATYDAPSDVSRWIGSWRRIPGNDRVPYNLPTLGYGTLSHAMK
jgi:hypothetical protein